jgi:hypothetical protein
MWLVYNCANRLKFYHKEHKGENTKLNKALYSTSFFLCVLGASSVVLCVKKNSPIFPKVY